MNGEQNKKDQQKIRARLLKYAKDNSSKDFLAQAIQSAVQQKSAARTNKKSTQKFASPPDYKSIIITGAEDFGLNPELVMRLAQTLPGAWLSEINFNRRNHPGHFSTSAGEQAYCAFEVLHNGLIKLSIYYPLKNIDWLADMLSSALVYAHAMAYYPDRISVDVSEKITESLDQIHTGHFHDDWQHTKKCGHLPKKYYHTGKNYVLTASFLQSLLHANSNSTVEDIFSCTQYVDTPSSQGLAEALEAYLKEIDPNYDLPTSSAAYINAEESLRTSLILQEILAIFDNMHDKGMKRFFATWLKDLQSEPSHYQSLAMEHGHVPSLRAGMALDDARELSMNIAESLRVGNQNPRDLRKNKASLAANIRRFNDIWNTLDKKEQKTIRPKVMRLIHASIV